MPVKRRKSLGRSAGSAVNHYTLIIKWKGRMTSAYEIVHLTGRTWEYTLDSFRGMQEDYNFEEGSDWDVVAAFDGRHDSIA